MDIQRLRTLTTGKGHTDYLDLQEDITRILGPIRQDRVAACALKAMKPYPILITILDLNLKKQG